MLSAILLEDGSPFLMALAQIFNGTLPRYGFGSQDSPLPAWSEKRGCTANQSLERGNSALVIGFGIKSTLFCLGISCPRKLPPLNPVTKALFPKNDGRGTENVAFKVKMWHMNPTFTRRASIGVWDLQVLGLDCFGQHRFFHPCCHAHVFQSISDKCQI